MRKVFIVLTLAASLSSGGPALLNQVWSLLTSVWGTSCGDAGLGMDPSGGCRPQSDAGLGMDPSGKPIS
jgi:hypothetical protein